LVLPAFWLQLASLSPETRLYGASLGHVSSLALPFPWDATSSLSASLPLEVRVEPAADSVLRSVFG
jgi:hypothetical protein